MDLPWFKFSPASWMIGRISRQTPEVQVAFLRLCCVYWNEGCDLTFERAGLEAEESLEILTKIRMVERSEDRICIKFLDEQFEEFKGKRMKQSFAGKVSAEKRMKKPKSKRKADPDQKQETSTMAHTWFESFWSRYPRKSAKQFAKKSWDRLSDEDKQSAIDGIVGVETISDPKFIPFPSTYLNGRRWEDEIIPKQSHEPTDRNEY